MSGLGAAWYRSLKSASRAGISVQPAVSDPVVAVRAALGVAIALFGALILVGRVHAVLPALGAELTGMATLQPGFRRVYPALRAARGERSDQCEREEQGEGAGRTHGKQITAKVRQPHQ